MVRNRPYVLFSVRLCQYLPEMFADSKLLRPQVLSIAHYILKVDASIIKHSPSRFHAKVVALVSGKTASFIYYSFWSVFGSFVSRARDACYRLFVLFVAE